MANINSYLAGANTCEGFVSYFDEFIASAQRVIILKGGPGCGKSTFMKKVASTLNEKGYNIDLIYCASDKESLDGVFVHGIDLIIVDGTAPHVIDPKYPGVVEKILNFGEYFNEEILLKSKKEIINIIDEKSKLYRNLYSVLEKAKKIHDRMEREYIIGMDFEKANKITKKVIEELNIVNRGVDGENINRFAGALTPQGQVIFYEDLLKGIDKKIIIKGRAGCGKSTLMKKIGKVAMDKGYNIESYHCGLDPNSLDMVVIRDLSFAVLDGTAPHVVDPIGRDKVIDMFEECIDKTIVNEDDDVLVKIYEEYGEEIKKAKDIFKEIKVLHEKIEKIYVKSVDFSKVDNVYNTVISQILNMK